MGVLRESGWLQALDAPERDGVLALRNASLTGALAQLLFVVGAALLLVDLGAHPGAAWNPVGLYHHALLAVALLTPAAVLGAASFLLYFSGFRKLATFSREFTSPAFLTLVGLFGVLLTISGLALLLAGEALSASAYALAPVAVLFGVPLLLLGIVLSVVGLFGQAVGSWGVGARYREGTLRSGAVLMVFPLLGNGLSFFGYRRALAQARPPTSVPA
jgi:hypothetical protein